MYLIVGLGNPEEEYGGTRHNMGFDAINRIAEEYGIKVNKKKFQALYGSGMIGTEKVVLIKPQTYMNLSGQAVRTFMDFYKVKTNQILVLYDDMDIEQGSIKIRKKGGPGGHNGMKSIIQHLGTEEFPRVRIGIGRPQNAFDKISYVLGPIAKEEKELLEKGVEQAKDAVNEIFQNGIEPAMNQFN